MDLVNLVVICIAMMMTHSMISYTNKSHLYITLLHTQNIKDKIMGKFTVKFGGVNSFLTPLKTHEKNFVRMFVCDIKKFLVAKLLYNYLCPSVRMSVRPFVRFRGKRDFLGP